MEQAGNALPFAWVGRLCRTVRGTSLSARVFTAVCIKEQTSRSGYDIQIIGIDDPDFADSGSGMFDLDAGIISAEIEGAGAGEGFKVLLSHRPEVLDAYAEKGIDLALCGHAHGGQFRLPFIGGLIAPDQGLFPRYDGGVYYAGDTAMVVSRGIGNSAVPVRVNNRPEIVFVVLHGVK